MNPSDDRAGKVKPQPPQSPAQPQDAADAGRQHGEGNYKASRDYNRGVKEHMQSHDVEREARDAAPRSEEEAREMRLAEEAGKRKAEGMRDPKDRMDDGGRGPGEGSVK